MTEQANGSCAFTALFVAFCHSPIRPILALRTTCHLCCRHYYLLDLCYYGNTLLLLHLWVWPQSYLLTRTTFALNTGPLAFTILAFRNSLVYHDMVGSIQLRLLASVWIWVSCAWCVRA